MSRVYDNWQRLVETVLKREELREIALCESFSSSSSADFSSRFSFDSSLEDFSGSPLSSRILSSHEVKPIEFKEIKKATNNFRPDLILDEGGFGPIFKGWIDELTLSASKPGSGMAIAVKKWNPDGFPGRKEWTMECNCLSQLRHPNLVKLIGYCHENDNLVLVHEFMPKGSLENHLFRRGNQSLSWATRIKVAVGAARGLCFLHESETQVIHRDVKCRNILLDGEFNPKLSELGLARDGPTDNMTYVSTRVMGTYGYAAPEYVATGHLTSKCDVYSFGVVLLELLCGRRVIDKNRVTKERNLVDWAKPYLHVQKKLSRIMDARLEGQYPHNDAYAVATLTLQCLSPDPRLRPWMAKVLAVLQQLEGPATM